MGEACGRDNRTPAGKLGLAQTHRHEISKMTGGGLDPDVIAVQLIEKVREPSGCRESRDVPKQRSALFAFCKRIVADAEKQEIVVETDLSHRSRRIASA